MDKENSSRIKPKTRRFWNFIFDWLIALVVLAVLLALLFIGSIFIVDMQKKGFEITQDFYYLFFAGNLILLALIRADISKLSKQ